MLLISYNIWKPAVVLAMSALVSVTAAAAPARPSEKARGATAPASLTPSAALAFRDTSGQAYGPSTLSKAKATAFIFTSTECPISNIYTTRIKEMAKDYRPRGAQFFLVNSNTGDTLERVSQDAKLRGFTFPVIKDEGTKLADRLGARCTPEVIILDATGEMRYRGRIDDNKDRTRVVRQDAKEALEAVLTGKPVKVPRTLAMGCAIFRGSTLPKSAGTVGEITYANDIAPILNRSCLACHRTGEVGPFALETYAQARTWSAQIKDYTARRIMPPWKAVPGHGEFHDARVLTDEEIARIARWHATGSPLGDPKSVPPAPRFVESREWSLGKPDMVVQPARAYHLEAEGPDVYRNFVLPVDFKEERFLSAMEFKPGNRAVVHHIVTYFDPTGKSAELDGKEKDPGYTVPGTGIGISNAAWGEVWVPGRTPRFMPEGVAIRIPKGSKLVMQVHYHKNGAPQADTSQVALYYTKGRVDRQVITWPLGNATFELKPGNSRQLVKSWFSLPADAHLRTMFPHMHLLGKEMKVTATLPDGTVKSLIWINDWDFNWQETYVYKEPVALPKGTRIEVVAAYDNSESNPHQVLHPPKTIRFGEQTTDEMCFAIIGLTFDQQKLNITPPVQSP